MVAENIFTRGEDMNARQIRGEDIARRLPIKRQGTRWLVPSQSGNAPYRVDVTGKTPTCTCPDYELTVRKCKHLYAVESLRAADVDGTSAISPASVVKAPRPTYRQDWVAYNLAQTNEKRHFQDLLADLCRDIADLPRQPGAGRTRLPMREMVFAACFKVYSTVSCRRFMSDLADAQDKGYLSRVPHFNSIFNYLELPEMTAVLRSLIERSSLPMKAIETRFAVDASGFTTCRYVRWYDAKYGAEWSATIG